MCTWQMALGRHVPDLPQDVALEPVFYGGERSDIATAFLMRVGSSTIVDSFDRAHGDPEPDC